MILDKKENKTPKNKEVDKKDNFEIEKIEITVLDKERKWSPDNKENIKEDKKENETSESKESDKKDRKNWNNSIRLKGKWNSWK